MKWEYHVDSFNMYPLIELRPKLAALGKEGWELVAVLPAPDIKDYGDQRSYCRAFFKRPISN